MVLCCLESDQFNGTSTSARNIPLSFGNPRRDDGAIARRNGADEPAPRLARSGPWPRVVFKAALVLGLEQSYRLQIDDRLRPCGSPIPPKVTDWLPTRCRSATSWKLCAGSRPGAGAGSVFAQAVDLGCHDEVVFVQAVDLLGP